MRQEDVERNIQDARARKQAFQDFVLKKEFTSNAKNAQARALAESMLTETKDISQKVELNVLSRCNPVVALSKKKPKQVIQTVTKQKLDELVAERRLHQNDNQKSKEIEDLLVKMLSNKTTD